MKIEDFSRLRYGMFVHFGLYSVLGRGEWAMNRERIAPGEMEKFAREKFHPDAFDAEALCRLAVEGGMRYIVFTTMHHDGFRLYRSELSDFNAFTVCGRDFVAEMVAAARKAGLRIGLYHSLNNWHDRPDAAAALENKTSYTEFIANTFARLRELTERFAPFDILWYDGWWPFDAAGWQAEKMNAEMRARCPGLLFNGRNGLSGDFGTPEQHLSAPSPWRPWEACVTLNDHWGFHPGDDNWKNPREIIKMLLTCAKGRGNLLLNVGPDGTGHIPEPSRKIIREVGDFLRRGGDEATEPGDPMSFGPLIRKPEEHGDWDAAGVFTASGDRLFLTMLYVPESKSYTVTGLECIVKRAFCCGTEIKFVQEGDKLTFELPAGTRPGSVFKFECEGTPSIYRTGGMRVPEVKHPRYDPVAPDLLY